MKKTTCLFGGALMMAGMATTASAQFTYPTVAGPLEAAGGGGVGPNPVSLNLGAAPAGPWNTVSVTADWAVGLPGGGGFSAYSSESLLGFGSTAGGLEFGGFFFSDNGVGNSDPLVGITWNFDFTAEYAGGSDLFLDFGSYFGYDMSLSNISVTLDFVAPPTFDLTPFSIGTLEAGDMVMGDTVRSSNDFITTNGNVEFGTGTGEVGGDDIYTLNWAGGDLTATLDILGDPAPDLDIFLYDADGNLIDRGFTLGNPEIAAGSLAAGTYFIRVDGFDSGEYKLSISPAPGAVALMGFAGLAGIRRRRA